MEIHHGEATKLSEKEINDILAKNHFGHLGCQREGEVYVVPITYAFEDNYIYSHSRHGKKIEMMKANPKVCLQVEKVIDLFHWKSAIVWGKFEELKNEKASQAMRILVRQLTKMQNIETTSSLEIDFEAILESAIIFRFKVDKSTGRSENYEAM